ncbi:hypothetical protein OPT61_g3445 [Boeremia exigua]|uniref:Uncharacterized protein n=1 Tax=Boeremia exigua TaxID=749465 RepID=A0ACC2II29_9PLEO|nr:hypothetical protein OPT61_g3445 [Boeremia exigua]
MSYVARKPSASESQYEYQRFGTLFQPAFYVQHGGLDDDLQEWDRDLQRERRSRRISEPATHDLLEDAEDEVCWRCKRIDFEGMVDDMDNWRDSAYLLGPGTSVVQNAQCSICKLFECLLQQRMQDGKHNDTQYYLVAFPTSALYASAWTWKAPPDEVTQTVSFSILDEISFRDSSRIRLWTWIRSTGCIAPVVAAEGLDGFQARKLGDQVDIAVVKAWLNYCGHHHLGSCTSSESPLHALTKVIDCRSKEVVYLRSGQTYLALSYVWGLPKRNEAEKDPKVSSSQQYPQTIEDAITLTEQLGYSYLWVDRYCIPQDNTATRQTQIAQMDKIYAGAEATIIAAAGDDPHYGLPGIRSREANRTRYATINGQLHTVIPPDPAHEIRASKWNSRAWTYQESMLSKRRIIFCDRQMYFECSAMHCYEAMQAPLHLLHSSLCSRFSEWNEPGLFPVEQHRHVLDQLFHHLALYTVRELSFPNDALSGMLGIFGAFTRRAVAAKSDRTNRRIMQIAGIPIVPNDTLMTYNPIDPPVYHLSREGQFLTGLSWKLAQPAKRRPGFPSWTWAGWYGAVLPRRPCSNATKAQLCRPATSPTSLPPPPQSQSASPTTNAYTPRPASSPPSCTPTTGTPQPTASSSPAPTSLQADPKKNTSG